MTAAHLKAVYELVDVVARGPAARRRLKCVQRAEQQLLGGVVAHLLPPVCACVCVYVSVAE